MAVVARRSQIVASSIGTVLAISFSSCAAFSRGIENCTQGDTDSYLFGLILCTPIAIGAVVAFWFSRRSEGWPAYLQVGITGLAVGLLAIILVPWVGETTIAGHHPCGPMYDDYVAYGRPVDRFVPLLYFGLLLPILAGSVLPVLPPKRKPAG